MKIKGIILPSTNRNWHEIAELTLYTTISWEVILFWFYVVTESGYELEISLPLSWSLGGVLQVWVIKHTLPQLSLKSVLLMIVGWGIIPSLLIIHHNISSNYVNYGTLLTLGCLIGQISQVFVMKYTMTQLPISTVLSTSLGWFIGCCLWLMSVISNNALVGILGLIAGIITGGIGGGITSYVLFPFKQSSHNAQIAIYRRYFKIRFLVGILLLHWFLMTIIPPSHPPGISETQVKIMILISVLEAYRLDYWQYPTTEQGLKVLVKRPTEANRLKRWHGPYCHEELLIDSWNNYFQYNSDGIAYELISFGPDGRVGGGDDMKEISQF